MGLVLSRLSEDRTSTGSVLTGGSRGGQTSEVCQTSEVSAVAGLLKP